MRGRKPRPVEDLRREDNPGKRKLAKPLKLAGAGIIEAPPDLPEDGRELWEEVVGRLYDSGVIDKVDRAALKAMCVQWAMAEQASRVLAKQGYFTTGSTGQLVEHPAVAIVRNAHSMFLRFAEQYGLTASARARIAATILGARPADQLNEFIDAEPEILTLGDGS